MEKLGGGLKWEEKERKKLEINGGGIDIVFKKKEKEIEK